MALCSPFPGKTFRWTDDSSSYVDLDLACASEVPFGSHVGAFGVRRRHHTHEGIDLYGQADDPVVAMENGRIVAIEPFTGPRAGFPWWLDTSMVMVEGEHGAVVYGELSPHPSLNVGDAVAAGTVLGFLAQVLRHDKGRPMFMLHVELYRPGIRTSCGVWANDAPCPEGLLDPTPLVAQSVGLDRRPVRPDLG